MTAATHDAVVLVTDYGDDDTYAGAVVGACWRVDPSLRCVVGTNGVPPGDALAGAYHVKAAAMAFPPGTVICAVVDPGVGTLRRSIAVEAQGVRCVAPDNGLVSYLWAEADPRSRRCVALAEQPGASPTFWGRDVFAPAAARLATGARLEECGEAVEAPLVLDDGFCRWEAGCLAARVIVIDHYGNAITSARTRDLGEERIVEVRWADGSTRHVARTYEEIDEELAVVVGSAGHVEIASFGRSAATLGRLQRGTTVCLSLAP